VSTNILALLIAITVVILFVVGLGGLSLLGGVVSQFLERPTIKFLKPQNHYNFAFAFDWPFDKDQAKVDFIKFSLFNPAGNPTRSELVRSFKPQDQAFAHEIEMGQSFAQFMGANGFNKAEVSIEVGSSKNGINYHFSYSGAKFQELLRQAKKTAQEEQAELTKGDSADAVAYEVPAKSFIADPMPAEEGVQLVLPNNPAFQSLFAGSGGGVGGGASAAAENFKVAKVWIEPGCIVCNACEGIYPEVFEVKPDTCVIRPTAPLDFGLRIQEAAEACPVEVIKFAKA
jgi:ferredoxin